MTCNGCSHFKTVEVAAKNIPARILFVCRHPRSYIADDPDSGRRIIRIRKNEICESHPRKQADMMRELGWMLAFIGESEKLSWFRYCTKPQWPEAWSRLRERIETMEIDTPPWCFDKVAF